MGTSTKRSLTSFLFPLLFSITFVLGQFGRLDVWGASFYIHEIVLFLGFVWYVPKIWKQKAEFHRALLFPSVAFVIAIILSIIFSLGDKSNTQLFLASGYLIRFIAYSSLVLLVPVTGGYRNWGRSLSIAGFVFALAGVVQFFLYPDLRNIAYQGWDPHYMRFVSTLFDPNIAGFMLISFLLITFLLYQTEQKYRKILGLVLVLEVTAIILTFSRSSIVTLAVILAAYSAMKKIWWPIFVAVGVGVLSFIFVPTGSFLSPMRIVSALARADNFAKGITLFQSLPVTGVGWFMVPAFENTSEITRAYGRLDNSFLFVLASTGIVGFSAFIWLVLRIGTLVKDGIRNGNQKNTVILIGLILLTLVIHSQFENIFFSAWGLMWWWVSVGLLISLQKNDS